MMTNRRWFLLWIGASAGMAGARLWLPETGLIEVPSRFARELRGECSFCGKHAGEVASLLGMWGRTARVCNECLGLCMDILGVGDAPEPEPLSLEDQKLVEELDALIAELERMNPELFAKIDEEPDPAPAMPALPPSNCSFCDAHHSDVGKLIAGPTVYICDRCAVDAATIVSTCSA